MSERGQIRNLAYARQRADFNGMRFGSITPTDIDGAIEFGDRVFVFMETKHGDADLPDGQRLFLERTCDRIQKSGADAIVLIVRNERTGDSSATYPIGDLPVVRYRLNARWHETNGKQTAREWTERFASSRLGREVKTNEQRATITPIKKDSMMSAGQPFKAVTDIEVNW